MMTMIASHGDRSLSARLKGAMKALQSRATPGQPPRYSFPIEVWREKMKDAPRERAAWITDGLLNGFDIYVELDQRDRLSRTECRNLPADTLQKLAITEFIDGNADKKAIWGPFKISKTPGRVEVRDTPGGVTREIPLPPELANYRVSPMGAVPKGIHFDLADEDKKWRAIHHLSHPRTGGSLNAGLQEEWTTVQYVQFREVVRMVQHLGVGAKLWTVDAKDAYLRVPIKADCIKFLCFQWAQRLWAMTSLSFGLASAPKIYTEFADMVLWIIQNGTPAEWWKDGAQRLSYHYIDDFFGGAPVGSKEVKSEWQYNAVKKGFEVLGIPTTPGKCEEPNVRTKILGFLYDTLQQKVFIPERKRAAMLALIDRILARKVFVDTAVLQSAVGKLRWASVCSYAGPAFVRRIEQAVCRAGPTKLKVRITQGIRDDLRWWKSFLLRTSEGISFEDILRDPTAGDDAVRTDASTSIGMGGFRRATGEWFRRRWADQSKAHLFANPKVPDIYWKEMAAVATACCLWGDQWRDMAVTFWCDNMSCVYSLMKRRCAFGRDDVMELIRIIADQAETNGFRPFIVHIPGKENLTADALSRFDEKRFHEDTTGVTMRDYGKADGADTREILEFLTQRAYGGFNAEKRKRVESGRQKATGQQFEFKIDRTQ